MRLRMLLGAAAAATLAAGLAPTSAAAVPAERMRAVNVVPPGESGFVSLSSFLAVTGGASSTYGPNFADQLPLYSGWRYKSFQFERTGTATNPGGNPGVTVYRDPYGVPQIYADNEHDLAFALGYTMAQDRMFQMDVFRHVGHGTLAALTGSTGLPMDEVVRRVSEGSQARLAELAAAPPNIQDAAAAFAAGVTRSMHDQCPGMAMPNPAPTCPGEYTLLASIVNNHIPDWTEDDTLAFGEYAGRFFGEFGHAELRAASVYLDMVAKLGQTKAEAAFNDLYSLQDPAAPTIITPADGVFPRRSGPAAATSFAGSAYANHDPALQPSAAALAGVLPQIAALDLDTRTMARRTGIPVRFGSNAMAVSGRRTADGNPLLYSGPQTGWAVPGFFWEVEMHDPQRDTRGVTVPAIPLLVIGRNADSGWSVTSALDGNSDTFILPLDATNTHYSANGHVVTLTTHVETLGCNNPPVTALVLPLIGGKAPAPCPLVPLQETVYHDPGHDAAGLADPDANHLLYVRASSVNHRFVQSLEAWDALSRQHTAAAFGQTLQNLALAFNFFYVDAAGEVAYFHTGRYPIRPVNADPNLPLWGDGRFDWQGFETWRDTPHVVDPSTGFLVNWNNKPALYWYSKAVESDALAPDRWGPHHQVEPLAADVQSLLGMTFERAQTVPEDVAYTDWRAHVLLPYLIPALQGSLVPAIQQVATALSAWDMRRVDEGGGTLHTAPTFFDRWVEHMLDDTFTPTLGSDLHSVEGIDCAQPVCAPKTGAHYVSVDNLDVPTMKYELAIMHTLFDTLAHRTTYDFLGGATLTGTILQAAHEAVAELTTAQGAAPSGWTEPVERGAFGAQGAGSVADLVPLPNRGSYGQVIEPLRDAVTPTATPAATSTATPATPTPTVPLPLPNTAPAPPSGAPALPTLVGAVLLTATATSWRRRARRRAGHS